MFEINKPNEENELFKEQFAEWLKENELIITACLNDIESCEFDKTLSDEMIACNKKQMDIQIKRINHSINEYNGWAKIENESKLELLSRD